MKYTIAPEVFQINPKLQFGILLGKGLNINESTVEDIDLMRKAEDYVRNTIAAEDLRSLPIIKDYRETMESAGINPNKFQVSTEAMLKRVLKGNSLHSINSLVDLCNVVSLRNQISLGGHDLVDIHEDLSVRLTRGKEKFLPFGSEEYEDVEEGELVFTSGDIVQTRKWIWRQSELGKITLDTEDVFFQLVGFDIDEDGALIKALDSLEKMVIERFGGSCQRFIVNKGNPEIEF